jgi:hypothetical protein
LEAQLAEKRSDLGWSRALPRSHAATFEESLSQTAFSGTPPSRSRQPTGVPQVELDDLAGQIARALEGLCGQELGPDARRVLLRPAVLS